MRGRTASGPIALLVAVALALVACAAPATGPADTSATEPTTTTSTPAATPPTGPAGGRGDEGEVFLEGASAEVRDGEAILVVQGSLPTPCHELDSRVEGPDQGRIQVDVLSIPPPAGTACIQVLEPFEEEISLGRLPPGDYTVVVNGELTLELQA